MIGICDFGTIGLETKRISVAIANRVSDCNLFVPGGLYLSGSVYARTATRKFELTLGTKVLVLSASKARFCCNNLQYGTCYRFRF